MQANFDKAYKSLNQGQKEAVEAIEGPVMVVAGPGTGKTTVLTLRIANILKKTDTPPDGILALTFTESAVASMRRKLAQYLGSNAYRVKIFTFHGFAKSVIDRFPDSFPKILGNDVATESEKLAIVEKILDKNNFEIIKSFGSPYHYVRGILKTISDLKRDAVEPKIFKEILKKEEEEILSHEDVYHEKGRYKGEMKSIYKNALKNVEKNRELLTVYEEYEEELGKSGLYDFDDMLLELLRAFERTPDLLQTLQEEYLYLLADEHQDANNAQNKILELLSGYFDEPNLFIVGDEKQAIYRFQGASLENFLYFKNKFKNARLINLDENYRSHQNILDVSHSLLDLLPGDKSLRPKLLSKGGVESGSIKVISFKTDRDENDELANIIEDKIKSGENPSEIAVLVRTNKEISEVGQVLKARGLPVNLYQDEDVLADRDIGKLLLLLRAIARPEDEKLVAEALFIDFLNIDPIEAIDLLKKNHKERISAIKHSKEWITTAKNKSALEAFTSIIVDSGFAEHLLKLPDSIQKMSLLSALYQEIGSRQAHDRELTLEKFLRSIDILIEHGSRLSMNSRIPKERSVSVMTVHKSKGLEWESVCMPHVVDGVWGNKRAMNDFVLPFPLGQAHQSGKEDDERRLFYVALTRAKKEIIITHSHMRGDGKELVLSRFVEELPKSILQFEEGKSIKEGEELKNVLKKIENKERTIWDKEYLREMFMEQGLTATALNNFLDCPWRYFFKNLIRIPDVPEKHQRYGNAMHAALGFYIVKRREGEILKLNEVIEKFEKYLNKEPFSTKDFEESLKKGKKALEAMYKSEMQNWGEMSYSEFKVDGVYLPFGSESLLLRGRLDKMDILDDTKVSVTDFKTGKPKSRNDILGETKSSRGNEKRQLDFYRLLLDLYDDGRYKMVQGVIMFTEPSEKGVIKKEIFEMTEEDSERVKKLALDSAEKISTFSFWDETCGKRDCEHCKLKEILLD